MGFLSRIKAAYRTLTLADFQQYGGSGFTSRTAAGIAVDEDKALTLSAFWNGVDIIAGQVGALPRIVYRRVSKNRGEARERATAHPAYRLLHDQPNKFMTPITFWQTLMGHVLTWGNAYAEIEYDNAMRPIALWPMLPNKMKPTVESYSVGRDAKSTRVFYEYDGKQRFEADEILHIPGLGFDGVRGYSVVGKARQSLGLALAAEQFGSTFFGNGAWPGIVLQHPKTLSAPAQERLIASFQERSQGSAKAHRVHVLEEGMEAQKIGIPPEDAQFLETREFQVVEIARWLNLPTWKLKIQQDARPGGNPEVSEIEFLTDTLRPWLIRIEQECNRKLISPAQRSSLYVEHLVEAALRMDSTSRAQNYKAYLDMGVIDAEFIAEKENFPPPPAPKAAPAPPPEPAPAPEPAPGPDGARMAAALRGVLVDQVARFVRLEAAQARKAADKGPAGFSEWLDRFYAEEPKVLRGLILPGVELHLAHAGVDGDAPRIADVLARGYMERSKDEFGALKTKDLAQEVRQLVERWEMLRPLEMADAIAAKRAAGGDHA